MRIASIRPAEMVNVVYNSIPSAEETTQDSRRIGSIRPAEMGNVVFNGTPPVDEATLDSRRSVSIRLGEWGSVEDISSTSSESSISTQEREFNETVLLVYSCGDAALVLTHLRGMGVNTQIVVGS